LAGLDPAIHVTATVWIDADEGVDHQVKPGDDDYGEITVTSPFREVSQ